MSTTNLIPGLACSSVEFFWVENELKFISNGTVKPFDELSFSHIQLIREAIASDDEIDFELKRMHPDSEYKRIHQFAICNFSGLDYTPDIKDGVLQKGEYWDCPKRGCCPGEGKICKTLQVNNNVIHAQEVEMIKMLTTEMTNEAIADNLLLPMGTFHLVKKKLYEKLGNIATKQELTKMAIKLNII